MYNTNNRPNKTLKLAKMAMLVAISIVLVLLIHFPLFPAAPFLFGCSHHRRATRQTFPIPANSLCRGGPAAARFAAGSSGRPPGAPHRKKPAELRAFLALFSPDGR